MRQDNRTHYEICELFKWANKTFLEEQHPEPFKPAQQWER
jgi:hypothetical protein